MVNIAVFVILITATAFGQGIKTKRYDLTNYNKIKVSSSIDVKLVANEQEGVSVSCDERLLPAIKVEKEGRKLNIGLDWKILKKICGNRRNQSVSITKNKIKINGKVFNGGIKVTAYVKQIKEIKTSSSGDVRWEGNLPTNELYLSTSSSGDIKWKGDLMIDKLHVECSSSGDVAGNYSGKLAFVKLSSSGGYKGKMNVDKLKVEISSSGDFNGKVNANTARFYLSSSGDARVNGNIGSLYVEASSSSDFYGKNLSKSGEVLDKTSRRTGVVVE